MSAHDVTARAMPAHKADARGHGGDAPGARQGADLRLVIPAAVAWVAVAIAIALPDALGWLAAGGWLATGILVVLALFGRRHPLVISVGWQRALAVAVLSCSVAALLLTSAAAAAPERQPQALLAAADAGRFVTATGVTSQTALSGNGSFTLTLTSVRVGDSELVAAIPARVFGVPPPEDIGIGATIALRGTLAATPPEDDTAFLVLTDDAPRVTSRPSGFLDWANGLRAEFRRAASTLPGDGGALLPGLAIGDTTAVGTELDEAMKDSSLSHLTAVSGANCAIVIGLVMVTGAMLGLSRGWRIASSVIALTWFVVLVTPEPSVLRAAVMALIAIVALAGGRPARGVPVLALSVIGLLTFDPWLARSYGFVLSVLATAGLLLLARPITLMLGQWLPLPVAAILSIPLAAQLACGPVLILLSASIPTYGVVANTIAGPAAPAATILGLIACVLLPLAPPVGSLVAHVAWLPASWIAAVATFFAALPGSRAPWLSGAAGVALLALVTVLVVIVVTGATHRRSRRVAAASLALLLAGYAGVAAGDSLRTSLTRPGDWQYAVCDIGQGDAVLVRSGGAVALVDTGPDPEPLEECLDELGIDRIDLLVLTHFDLDHVGGTAAVIGRVDTAIVGASDGTEADLLITELGDGGADIVVAARGDTGELGDLRWSVLWPPSPLRGIEPGNDASITLAIRGVGPCDGGCLSAAFLGDLGERAQSLVLATNRITPVDVVKVAHHGSADQDPRLYRRLAATLGLVSVGADNTYGHPNARLLDILESTGTAVARTDLSGMVLVAPGSELATGVELWTERSPPADVAPHG